jgi:L-alanine-DL-glutamate epimerase-like enolase superfamily enzyme
MKLDLSAYTVPTDRPESDGTFAWDATTLVVVEVADHGATGLGWTYAPSAAGAIVGDLLEGALSGRDPLDVPGAWAAMVAAVRNAGPWGLCMYAIAAVDIALWDLKARVLDRSLVELLGRRRDMVEIYGSGGFCSYTDAELREQLGGWAAELRRVRERAPAGMAIAAGEYATSPFAFRSLLGAVDVLQADVTRCGGITGFLRADALCDAHAVPLSAHCAPSLAVHPMAAALRGRHIEWFHDHVRIESMLFDGVLVPEDGALRPDPSAPGHGMTLKRRDAERYRVG